MKKASGYYQFHEGLKEAITRLEGTDSVPLLVAVHGQIDAGKTTLINLLFTYFSRKGFKGHGFRGNPSIVSFRGEREQNQEGHIYLYHCGVERDGEKTVQVSELNDLARRFYKKDVDLHIGIWRGVVKPKGYFDLLIYNPEAKIKQHQKGNKELSKGELEKILDNL